MLFFGHLGITIFIGTLFYLPALFVGVGSILPDIVDKGLLFLGISPYTRLVAHNLFFGPILSAITYLVTKRKDLAIAMLFGSYMHLLEDVRQPLPWLWPLVNYNFEPVREFKLVVDWVEIIAETVGLSLLVILFAFRKQVLQLREKISAGFKDFYDRRIIKKI